MRPIFNFIAFGIRWWIIIGSFSSFFLHRKKLKLLNQAQKINSTPKNPWKSIPHTISIFIYLLFQILRPWKPPQPAPNFDHRRISTSHIEFYIFKVADSKSIVNFKLYRTCQRVAREFACEICIFAISSSHLVRLKSRRCKDAFVTCVFCENDSRLM